MHFLAIHTLGSVENRCSQLHTSKQQRKTKEKKPHNKQATTNTAITGFIFMNEPSCGVEYPNGHDSIKCSQCSFQDFNFIFLVVIVALCDKPKWVMRKTWKQIICMRECMCVYFLLFIWFVVVCWFVEGSVLSELVMSNRRIQMHAAKRVGKKIFQVLIEYTEWRASMLGTVNPSKPTYNHIVTSYLFTTLKSHCHWNFFFLPPAVFIYMANIILFIIPVSLVKSLFIYYTVIHWETIIMHNSLIDHTRIYFDWLTMP